MLSRATNNERTYSVGRIKQLMQSMTIICSLTLSSYNLRNPVDAAVVLTGDSAAVLLGNTINA